MDHRLHNKIRTANDLHRNLFLMEYSPGINPAEVMEAIRPEYILTAAHAIGQRYDPQTHKLTDGMLEDCCATPTPFPGLPHLRPYADSHNAVVLGCGLPRKQERCYTEALDKDQVRAAYGTLMDIMADHDAFSHIPPAGSHLRAQTYDNTLRCIERSGIDTVQMAEVQNTFNGFHELARQYLDARTRTMKEAIHQTAMLTPGRIIVCSDWPSDTLRGTHTQMTKDERMHTYLDLHA